MKNDLQQIERKLDLLLSEVQKLQGRNGPSSEDRRFTIEEAAKKLNLSVSRIYALIYEGKLTPLQREKYSRIQFTEKLLNQYMYGKSNR